MNKKILSLILAVVMVVSMLPANVMAAQTGFTAAPSESGALTAVNPATTSTSGPMSLTESASKPVEVTQTGIVESTVLQSVTDGELTKLELLPVICRKQENKSVSGLPGVGEEEKIAERLARLSKPYGVKMSLEDGIIKCSW